MSTLPTAINSTNNNNNQPSTSSILPQCPSTTNGQPIGIPTLSISSTAATAPTTTTTITTTTVTTSTKISPDDAFYENLTLGLVKVLNNIPRITNVVLEKRQPCERAHVATWEQRHNVYLPDDMKKFYLSTDGFTLHWCYQYSPEDTRRVGFLSFPHLIQITLLRENIESLITATAATNSSMTTTINSTTGATKSIFGGHHHHHHHQHNDGNNVMATPNLCSRSKIFEISSICDLAKVCLVYETPEISSPKIYLLENQTYKWQFLADTFTEYQRMSIAHLGLPYWELCFSSCGLPSWAEQLFLLLAPHLLDKNSEPRRSRLLNMSNPLPPYNQLDPAVFRTKPKCPRPTATKK